jgi:glycosyltransferase involved in cell wall biosynthesis
MQRQPAIAILIPCFNEELTIGKVVRDFKQAIPEASIHVWDNNCTDRTAEIAAECGAVVVREPSQGKGYAVRAMLDSVVADYYVMVDGDDTYPADRVRELLAPVLSGEADMAVGSRMAEYEDASFRPLHIAGNSLVRTLINRVFGANLKDILSGYRAFNDRVKRYIPVVSSGFEVETELTVQMLYHGLTLVEIPVPYGIRPEGSESKLNTVSDGIRVLWKIFRLFRDFKPMAFFGCLATLLFLCGLLSGTPAILDYLRFQYVYHVPLAILATGFVILGTGSLFLGVLLQVVNWRLKELHSVIVRKRD